MAGKLARSRPFGRTVGFATCGLGIGGGCFVNWMVNQVIEWLDENGDPVTERPLGIDPTYTDAYLFDFRDPQTMPVWRRT